MSEKEERKIEKIQAYFLYAVPNPWKIIRFETVLGDDGQVRHVVITGNPNMTVGFIEKYCRCLDRQLVLLEDENYQHKWVSMIATDFVRIDSPNGDNILRLVVLTIAEDDTQKSRITPSVFWEPLP